MHRFSLRTPGEGGWLVDSPQARNLTYPVKTPYDLLKKAEAILRERDPEFEFLHQPIEVYMGGHSRILFRGHLEIEGYHVWVEHGFLPGMPGTDESISITLNEACSWVAGSASAQLLALP